MRARAIGPIPTAFPNPVTARPAAILLFLLSECFNESLSPLFFATTRATLRGIYHRVYKWKNGEEMRLYTASPEIFWFLEDKKRGFV